MNKTVKILSVLLIAVCVMSIASVSFASLTPNSISPDANVDSNTITPIAGRVLGWIRNIAAIASVIVLSILGVKFMIGSTEERAEYKKSFLPLIIGLFVVLAASTIAGWIWTAFSIK